jgi:hypothetical protein
MYLLNRSAVVVHARQPYFDWANSIDHGEVTVTADPSDRRGFSGLFLLPPFEEIGVEDSILRDHFAHIFENQLFAWHEDPELWPKDRTYEMFLEWFEVEFLDFVYDDSGMDMEGEEV